jgi:thiol-disulfide isomerase/thioredoxin
MRWFGATVLMCLIACFSPSVLGATQAASPVPPFELVTFEGESYSNESLKGRPALLIFWAPWCKVCQKDLQVMGEFYQRERPAQLRVISIGFADTRTNVAQFVKEHAGAFVFPSAYDEDRWVARAFTINATPTYVLLDAQGSIVLIHRGEGLLQNFQFRDYLSKLKGNNSAG